MTVLKTMVPMRDWLHTHTYIYLYCSRKVELMYLVSKEISDVVNPIEDHGWPGVCVCVTKLQRISVSVLVILHT